MNKKIYFGVLTAAMLLATSCSEDEQMNEQLQGTAQMTFTIDLENQIHTRAISDGTGTDQLVYAVFNEDGTETVVEKTVIDGIDDLTKSYMVRVALAQGKKYKAVFWAQNSECDAYTISDDMTVTVDYSGLNNDEARDAFFAATEPFKVSKHSAMNVVLKRPFAQVNVGTYDYDLEVAKKCNVDVSQSSATIKNVANSINLLDGSVAGSVDVTYTAANLPGEQLLVDADYDDVKEAYEYISMSYVLADTKSTTHEMEFNFSADNGEGIRFNKGLNVIPILRNWRTNIVGQILTGTTDFTVKIDPEYEGNYQVVSTSTGVYYNVSEDLTISNCIYLLDNIEDGAWFASQDGQLITLNNVKFFGSVWTVVLGEYRGPKYAKYNNELNNVECKDLVVSNVIKDHDVYVSVGTCVYGNSTLNNCHMSGTTTVATTHFDGSKHDYIPVDLGVPNECNAILNGGSYGSMYLWTHAVVDINNAKVGTIISSTCNSTNHSMLTIGEGTTVDVINCTQPAKYGSRLTIKEGAVVNELNLVNVSMKDMTIEGTVHKITYNGVEYTLDEIKAMNE